jgi:penicillin-binding protein 1C
VTRRRARALGALAAVVLGAGAWIRLGPLPPDLLAPERRVSTDVVDRHGVSLQEALSADGTRSRPLTADDLPPNLVAATLAAEDRRFFGHLGVDPLAIARAMWHNVRARRMVEGGSTITQQTVKQLIARPRTARGKLREVLLALRLEHALSKREILALYLTVAPYGNQIVGAEAASRAYFGCAARDLTPAQAAFLAGLPQRPSAFNPWRGPAAFRRQRQVLEMMAAQGAIDAHALAVARAERLRLTREPRRFLAPHFVERVRAEVPGRPRRIETTLDAELQRRVRGIVEMHRARLLTHGAHNVAIAVMDNASGEWLAWEGSGDYEDQDHGGSIDGVVSPRQPGSALKPFTYALAFERDFTPASVLPDVPAHFETAREGVLYSPRNYDGVFRGPLRARAALAGSENVPAVWLLAQTGVPELLRLLRGAGFGTLEKTADYYGYALTMGDAEVRLADVVAAYAALARGGVYRTPRMVRGALDAKGASLAPREQEERRIVAPETAFWVADVLADGAARAYIFGRGGSLEFPFRVAAKTGTSQAYHDNWTIGFTRDVTVGVWVGNFDRAPLQSASGVVGAAPIFHDVMMAAQEHVSGRMPGETDETLQGAPAGLSSHPICLLSGLRASDDCPTVGPEWLRDSRLPARCTWHRSAGGRAAVVWPARYRAWARAQGLLDARSEAEARRADPRRAPPVRAALRIVSPPPGSTYLRDPTLRAEFQTLPLRAETSAAVPLSWEVDGRAVGTASSEAALSWPLRPGAHVVAVTDPRGRRAEAAILVK